MSQNDGSQTERLNVAALDTLESRLIHRARRAKYGRLAFPVFLVLAGHALYAEYHFSGNAIFGLIMAVGAILALMVQTDALQDHETLVLVAALRQALKHSEDDRV